MPRLKRLRTAAASAGTKVYAALADIGNAAALGGVAKVEKVAYSGGVCGYGSLCGIG